MKVQQNQITPKQSQHSIINHNSCNNKPDPINKPKSKQFYQIFPTQQQNNPSFPEQQQQEIITLVKFNDQQLLKKINKQFFQQQLKKYSLEQRKYLIIDKNNLRIIDTRQQNAMEIFNNQKSLISKSTLHTSNNQNSYNEHMGNNNIIINNNNKDNNNNKNQQQFLDQKTIQSYHNLHPRRSSKLQTSSIWQSHWRQSNKLHQQFLSCICHNNYEQFIKYLNRRQNCIPLQINFRSQSNWCPIHYAAMHCSPNIISILINHPQIDINILTDFNWTALHIAVQSNKIDNCQLLISAGVCVDYKDNQGYTAMHYAAEFGYKAIIELLIKNGGSQYIKNNKGFMPKELCQSEDLIKIFLVNLLQSPTKQQQQQSYYQRFYKLKRNVFVEKMLTSSPQSNHNETNKNMNKSTHNISYNNQSQQNQSIMSSKKNIQNNSNNQRQKQTDKKLQPSSANQVIQQKQKQKAFIKTASNNRKKNILKMYQLIINKKSQPMTLSSFRFYKKVGQGAFGQVYVVKKIKSDKLYALKAIKKQRVIGTALYRYIQTQKQILSLISHPFVVRLNCAFQTEAYLFLVMDYCEGGDLSRLLEKKQRLQEKVVKMYAAEILLGLEALHKNMIIYRDLKPENIVLDKDGHACITDFGLSKKTNDLDAVNKSFCGTPAYLPLEIINKKGHTRMADWYEYGIVLYELLTGIPPFYAETKTELYDKVRAGVIRFPKNSSQMFRDLIKKLLAQNPQKRLGFQNDADSIKQHQWFKDINWDDVYQRKLPVPPVQNKIKVPSQPIKSKFADIKSEKYFIPSWSFID